MKAADLKPNKILRGLLFPEPVQVIVAMPMGAAVKLIGKGQNTKTVYEPSVLEPSQFGSTRIYLLPAPHAERARAGLLFA